MFDRIVKSILQSIYLSKSKMQFINFHFNLEVSKSISITNTVKNQKNI